MRELAGDVRSVLFFVHIRGASGSAAQEINCRRFCHSRLLLMHSGRTDWLKTIIRDLMLALDESLRPEIKRQTNNEVLVNLALMFRPEDDPRKGCRARSALSRRGGTSEASSTRSRARS